MKISFVKSLLCLRIPCLLCVVVTSAVTKEYYFPLPIPSKVFQHEAFFDHDDRGAMAYLDTSKRKISGKQILGKGKKIDREEEGREGRMRQDHI